MSTPAKTAAPQIVEPDDLLSIAAAEAAKDDTKGGETDVTADDGEELEPTVPPAGSSLPAVPTAATPVAITSTALTAFTDNEWAGFDDDGGLLNWQHVGFSIPRIVSDMRPGGGWTDEVTTIKSTELDVIVIAAMPTRAWWEEEFGTGSAAPDCRSLDMIRPDASSPKKQSGTCATCPLSQWTETDPPACSERINTLVYLPETGEVRRLTIGGTSVKHFRRYASALQARAGRKPIYAQVTRMTLEDVDNGKMRWLEAHYVAGDPISPAEAARTIKPMKDTLVEQWKSLLAEALASGEADGSAVAAGDAIDVDGREKYADEEPF